MCGIVAVLRESSDRTPPSREELLAGLDRAAAHLSDVTGAQLGAALADAAAAVEAVDALLRGTSGIRAVLGDADLAPAIEHRCEAIDERVRQAEAALDAGTTGLFGRDLEGVNATLVRLKDAVWSVHRDRLRSSRAVADLLGEGNRAASTAAVEAFASIQTALSAIDRLEIRGRDSAGVHVLVTGHGLDLDAADVTEELGRRTADRLFTSLAVRTPAGHLSFVYKAAAEIGELGDNTAVLRGAIAGDDLLHRAVQADVAEATVLGHTRWASVGLISQPNTHPLNNEEVPGGAGPYVVAALNGDVDNHAELVSEEGLSFAPEFTTDAKVIPALVSRRRAEGVALDEAFRATVASFEGSVAIAASAAEAPDQLLLALKGSGQGLYIGLTDGAFVVASEPYGLVEETARYVRMDGETTGGQVVVLDRARAGRIEGIRRIAYDGTELPVSVDEVQTAPFTTRDIDRGGFPHFLLKEISEAPQSFRKTLRGRVVGRRGGGGGHGSDGRLTVALDETTLPAHVAKRLGDGEIGRVLVIGQGTAAVAGQSLAAALQESVARDRLRVEALTATELSGFLLDDDMSDALVIAISQSGTTTDTNRTIDLVRSRGASVIAIVNRRSSDIVERADGVLYTSDGRDVEVAVPSTKAFYAQVAAGFLLAVAIADLVGSGDGERDGELLAGLRDLPDAMDAVLASRPAIADAAHRHAPSRRYWAIVGNGRNRIAAEELRIKLSELCYKSISCDATEDKKHIDLSSEPLILVCAAGLTGSTAGDVAKEVAIFRAHKALPIVVATEGGPSFDAAVQVLAVPPAHPSLAFVLTAMAGHLFGYEAALAIDEQALLFHECRAVVENLVDSQSRDLLADLAGGLEPLVTKFFAYLRTGSYDGHLEASTAVRLAALFRYAQGLSPLDAYEIEYGKVGTPAVLVDDLTQALTRAIEELTRPIDAIKHQAKTVTVGISRTEEDLFAIHLVQEALSAGAGRDRLSYRVLRALAALDPAVAEVTGYTRYRIDGTVADGTATIQVVDKGGVATTIASRVDDRAAPLLGTKRGVAASRRAVVARGLRDGRTLVIVPEAKDNQVTNLTLLHVRFEETVPAETARPVLEAFGRWSALVDVVSETEGSFDEARLATISIADLLVEPIATLAARWRQG